MTTGKTIALTRWTFVGKVISLLFNMLSRLVLTSLPRSKYLLISWLQSPSAVILKPKKVKSDTVSTVSPSISYKTLKTLRTHNFFLSFPSSRNRLFQDILLSYHTHPVLCDVFPILLPWTMSPFRPSFFLPVAPLLVQTSISPTWTVVRDFS